MKYCSEDETIHTKVMKGDELKLIIDHIKTLSMNKRIRNDSDDEFFVILHGDDVDGNSDLVVPEDGPEFIYGIFAKYSGNSSAQYMLDKKGSTFTINKIAMNDDTKLLSVSYFVIHINSGIAVMINDRNVGSARVLCEYFNHFILKPGYTKELLDYRTMLDGHNDTIGTIPIFDHNQMDKIKHMKRISSLNFVTYNLSDDEFRGSSENSLLGMVADRNVGTTTIDVTIKSSSDGSLDPSIIEKILPRKKELYKLRATGKGSDGSNITIDLFEQQFSFTSRIKYEGNYMPASKVFDRMKTEFNRSRNELNLNK